MMSQTTKNWLPVVAILVGAALWNAWCDNPQVRRDALQVQQDTRDDSTHDANERWKADFAAREMQRESTLSVIGKDRDYYRHRAAVLTARTIVVDSATLRATLLAQLAVRDTLIANSLSVIAQQDIQVSIYRAMVVDRDSLLVKREREIAALTTARDVWKRQAQQPSYTVTDIVGGAALGYGLAEENEIAVAVGVTAIVAPRVFRLIGKIF